MECVQHRKAIETEPGPSVLRSVCCPCHHAKLQQRNKDVHVAPRASSADGLCCLKPRPRCPGPQEPVGCERKLLDVEPCSSTWAPGCLLSSRLTLAARQWAEDPPGQPCSVYLGLFGALPRGIGADGHRAALGCFGPEL